MQDLLQKISRNYATAKKAVADSLPWKKSPKPVGLSVEPKADVKEKARTRVMIELQHGRPHPKRFAAASASGLPN
jgi:hypothetical protein